MKLSNHLRTALPGAVLFLAMTTGVRAQVGLEWRPDYQQVEIGQTVEVGLYAVSEYGDDHPVSVVEAILDWDADRLEFLGVVDNGPYNWLISGFPGDAAQDGLNAPYTGLPDNDGDAWYNAVSSFPPSPLAVATTEGLLVTSFQFTATHAGTLELSMPPTAGSATNTQVWDGEVAGLIITGTIGPPAVIEVVADPIPAVSTWGLAVLVLTTLMAGTLVFRRHGFVAAGAVASTRRPFGRQSARTHIRPRRRG